MADTTKTILSTLISVLKASATITALVSTRIYTSVPQNATYPYLSLSITSEPENTLDAAGLLHRVRIISYSQGDSIKSGLDIKEAIYNLLERSSSFEFCHQVNETSVINHAEDKIIQTVQDFEIS